MTITSSPHVQPQPLYVSAAVQSTGTCSRKIRWQQQHSCQGAGCRVARLFEHAIKVCAVHLTDPSCFLQNRSIRWVSLSRNAVQNSSSTYKGLFQGFFAAANRCVTEERYFASVRKLGFASPQLPREPSSISRDLSRAISDLCWSKWASNRARQRERQPLPREKEEKKNSSRKDPCRACLWHGGGWNRWGRRDSEGFKLFLPAQQFLLWMDPGQPQPSGHSYFGVWRDNIKRRHRDTS